MLSFQVCAAGLRRQDLHSATHHEYQPAFSMQEGISCIGHADKRCKHSVAVAVNSFELTGLDLPGGRQLSDTLVRSV